MGVPGFDQGENSSSFNFFAERPITEGEAAICGGPGRTELLPISLVAHIGRLGQEQFFPHGGARCGDDMVNAFDRDRQRFLLGRFDQPLRLQVPKMKFEQFVRTSETLLDEVSTDTRIGGRLPSPPVKGVENPGMRVRIAQR